MLVGVSPALQSLLDLQRRHLGSVASRAAAVTLLAVTMGLLLLARGGTEPARLVAAVGLLLAWSSFLLRPWLHRRALSDDRRAIRKLMGKSQPEHAAKLLRAHDLKQRVTVDSGVSPELAALHFDRLLQRADRSQIEREWDAVRRRWRLLALIAAGGTVAILALMPFRVFEGLNVLLSRQGIAPVAVQWVEFPYVEAQAPAYLGRRELRLGWQTAGVLPQGTTLRVRGRPARDGRTLVVTNGKDEVPFVDDGGGAVVATWVLEESASLRIAARFGDTLILEPQSVQLYAQPDRVPEVVVDNAPRELDLATLQQLEVRWSAADDHQLSQVDLVLRSGGREERRTLERPAQGVRAASGALLLQASDEFLERAFLPVIVRVEAKDNHAERGEVWGRSQAIVIRPPSVGAPQTERHAALSSLLDELVDVLAAHHALERAPAASEGKSSRAETARAVRQGLAELRVRVNALEGKARDVLERQYAGLTISKGLANFVIGRLQALSKEFARGTQRLTPQQRESLERGTLALDSAFTALARRDARDVSKALGDVADEAAFAARQAQEGEEILEESTERLDLAIDVISEGAVNLRKLGVLGADIGSVAAADLWRVRTSREQNDFLHAELAALHLAARLHRPNPSFGAKGGGGGAVESGMGSSGGQSAQPEGEPSDADSAFDRLARELAELAEEHADALERSASALDDAESQLQDDGLSAEAKRRADELRRAVLSLPQPGEAPSTSRASAALSREHAGAMAHEFENLDFDQAVESGRRARASAEEALRRGDLDDWTQRATQQAAEAINEQLAWAQQQQQQRKRQRENQAREALSEVARLERELSERAGRLASEPGQDVALPQEVQERLREAEKFMREASHRLGSGDGETGVRLQRQAQRLLEESETGQTSDQERSSQQPAEQRAGRNSGFGGEVPAADDRKAAEEFRRRVLEGLGRSGGGRLSPAVKRYAEGLLR